MTDYSTTVFTEPVPVAEPPREDGQTRPSKWDSTIARLSAHPDQWFMIAETLGGAELHYLPSLAARRGVTIQITQRVGGPKGDRTTRVYARSVSLPIDEDLDDAKPIDIEPEITHCGKGHEFTPENTGIRVDGRGRSCKACQADRSRTWRTGGRAAC